MQYPLQPEQSNGGCMNRKPLAQNLAQKSEKNFQFWPVFEKIIIRFKKFHGQYGLAYTSKISDRWGINWGKRSG